MTARVVSKEFPPVAASARAARQLMTHELASTEVDRPELLELFVSELVTNAIIHAGTTFRVAAEIGAEVVRISISDQNPEMPMVKSPRPGSVDGRGLKMVSELAQAWGVDASARGKTVWFELARKRRASESNVGGS